LTKTAEKAGLFQLQSMPRALKSRKFPVFSLMIREFDVESSSHQTASSATQFATFTYNLRPLGGPWEIDLSATMGL